MATDFGKLDFSVSLARKTAFPLDAWSYFERYTDAVAAAATAVEAGSSGSKYYLGQLIIVNEANNFGLYQINRDKGLTKFGQASSADELANEIKTLKDKYEELNTEKVSWFNGSAPTNNNDEILIVGAAASAAASGVKIAKQVDNVDTEVPTSKAVQAYVAIQVASAVQYLGLLESLDNLSTTAGKGDFYRLGANLGEGYHAGDLLIATKDNPATINDWQLVHGENVGVEGITVGNGLSKSGTDANPSIAIKPATTTAIGGVIVGSNLTVDATGKLSAKDTTYEDATQTVHGLMSTDDKKKLDGIAAGANKTTVDTNLDATSTNPVQNKAVHAEFAAVRTAVGTVETDLTAEIAKKVNIEDIATTVEQGNSDPVSSDAVANALELNKYTLPAASTGALGGIKVGYTASGKNYPVLLNENHQAYVNVPWENTTYTAGNGLTLTATTFNLNIATADMQGGIKLGYKESGKNYAVQLDANNKAYVTVPWSDTTYTLPTANETTLGGIKVSKKYVADLDFTTGTDAQVAAGNRIYPLVMDSGNIPFVYVPWTDTKYTLPVATKDTLGGVKAGTTSDKTYGVNVAADGAMTVTVPWTDNNTFRPITVGGDATDLQAPIDFQGGTNISVTVAHNPSEEKISISHTGPGSASQTTTGTKAEPSLVEDGGTVAFGKEFYVPSFGIDANGHTRDLKMTKYKLPTPETYSLPIATTTVLGGIKSGNKNNNFAAGSGNVKNYEAEVVVNSTTGKATVDFEKLVHGEDLGWDIGAGYTYITINQVSTDKLVQGSLELVLNGGGANL